jgi:DNA-binding response OmpR family regulator
LCVEPDDGTRRLLADAAKGAGHRALSASNARQGLRLLFAAFPDLVVLDAALGNESGYRMCEELRNDPSAREMPVLMFNVADRASAAMAGATVMLPAPFEAARVVEAMNALLRPKAPVAAKPGGPVGKSGAPVGKPGDPRNPFGSG